MTVKGTRPQTVMTVKGLMSTTKKTFWHFLAFIATWRHSNARLPRAGHRHPLRGDPTHMTKWQMRWVQNRTQSLSVPTPGICLALSATASWPCSTDTWSPSTSALFPPLPPSRLPLCCHPCWPFPKRMTPACRPQYGPF